jgi:hypothetical protein
VISGICGYHGWIFWQAVESEQTQTSLNKNWGLIHADFTSGNRYYLTKKYHAVRQFYGFIRPYSKMIEINNNDAVAFITKGQDRLIIVQRNAATSSVSFDYGLSDFERTGSAASVWRTSGTENCRKLDDLPVVNGTLSATSPRQSITTYVIPLNPTSAAVQGKTVAGSPVQIRCSNTTLKVVFTAPGNQARLNLYDLKGNQVQSIALETAGSVGRYSGSHDLSRLPNGNYLVEIVSGGHTLHTAKVVIAK